MSNIVFDCTQIISFNLNQSIDIKKTFSQFEKINFSILADREIETKKITYLNEYLSTNNIELLNKEFVGEFEDWKKIDEVPQWISDFITTLERVIDNECIESMTLIMIEYASQMKNENNVCHIRAKRQNLSSELFAFSKSNYDYWGNIMIFSIEH